MKNKYLALPFEDSPTIIVKTEIDQLDFINTKRLKHVRRLRLVVANVLRS